MGYPGVNKLFLHPFFVTQKLDTDSESQSSLAVEPIMNLALKENCNGVK